MKMMQSVLLALAAGWSFIASAIINGVPIPSGDFSQVVTLKVAGDTCNGVLIGPKVIATAAHCVRTSQIAEVILGGRKIAVTFTKSPFYPARNHDLALGVLSEEQNEIIPSRIADKEVTSSDAVTLVGSGCVKADQVSDGVMRVGSTVVDKLQQLTFSTKGGGNYALACYGDSGAPGFVGERASRQVAGILAFGNLTTTSYLVRFDSQESQNFLHHFSYDNLLEICGFEGGC